MKRIIELFAGEGGDDADSLVLDLSNAYLRHAARSGWKAA